MRSISSLMAVAACVFTLAEAANAETITYPVDIRCTSDNGLKAGVSKRDGQDYSLFVTISTALAEQDQDPSFFTNVDRFDRAKTLYEGDRLLTARKVSQCQENRLCFSSIGKQASLVLNPEGQYSERHGGTYHDGVVTIAEGILSGWTYISSLSPGSNDQPIVETVSCFVPGTDDEPQSLSFEKPLGFNPR